MKTRELTGAALDWAVTKIETGQPLDNRGFFLVAFKYSTDWAASGPIIEREKINLQYFSGLKIWLALSGLNLSCRGATPLVAAMRCFVASRLGDNVDIPEELK